MCPKAKVKFFASNGSKVKDGFNTVMMFIMMTIVPEIKAAVLTITTIVLATTVVGGASSSDFFPKITSQPSPLAKLPYSLIIARPQSFIQEHAKKVKASISVETTIQENAVLLDEQINRKMISCCQQLGISYQKMIRGAGHDAMNIAKC